MSVGDAEAAADGAGPDTRDTPAGDREDDLSIITRQLGRTPAGPFEVIVRSSHGQPAVIANAPFLADGTPMPTRYWLTDPDLRDAVSRLESEGGVRAAEQALPATAIAEAHARYAATR